MTKNDETPWPEIAPLSVWEDTRATVHMWSQIVGKIRLELSPFINHSWGCALYVTTRGLTTSPIPYKGEAFTIDFDFVDHLLRITHSNGSDQSFGLEPMSVAEFYRKIMQTVADLGIQVKIYEYPVEVLEAIPFSKDQKHASYDSASIHSYWQALVTVRNVFTQFRAGFIGKNSPVHLFWGAFDLAVTRFSGRLAPKHAGGAPHCPSWVMEEAYSHEVSSAGFWPGQGLGEAAFYSYAYPGPAGFSDWQVHPEAAYFNKELEEFILPYEAVRKAADPTQELLAFLQSTYEGAATLAKWDRQALEGTVEKWES